MELPIQFPNESDVIYDEAMRFRALSPAQKIHEINEAFRLYQFLRTSSGRAEQIDLYAEEMERLGRQSIQEFASRHG